jgi:hypothetical protein
MADSAPDNVRPLRRPLGTQTGFANTLSDLLAKRAYRWLRQGAVGEFVERMRRTSLGYAGYQGEDPTPGERARFELRAWAETLEMGKPQIVKLRDRLVERGILTYQEEAAGSGWLYWQTDTSRWPTTTRGGKREGAGRPARKLADVSSLINAEEEGSSAVSSLINSKLAGVSSLINSEGENKSKWKRQNAPQPRQAAAASPMAPFFLDTTLSPQEKETPEKETLRAEAHASGRAHAPARMKGQPANMSDEEFAYRLELCAKAAEANGVANWHSLPASNGFFGAAGKFYRERLSVADVMAFYAVERKRPRYDSEVLHLADLFTKLPAWRLNGPAKYAASIGRKRDAVEGRYEAMRAETATPPPARRGPRMVTARPDERL